MSGTSVAARPGGRWVLRAGPVSLLVRSRAVAVVAAAVVVTVGTAVVALGLGGYHLSPAEVVQVLLGAGTRAQRVVVLDLRLPRVLAGVLVGAALGLAGALTQGVARNPLASPDVLGVTQGASAGAVAVIVLARAGGPWGEAAQQVGVPVAALVGALAAAAAVYALAWRRGVDGLRLVLVGLMVGEMLSAAVQWMLERAEVTSAAQATVWLDGSLANRTWDDVVPVLVGFVVLAPLAAAGSAVLGAMQLGEDTARALGVPVQRAQLAVVVCAVGLTTASVVAAGPVGFIALAVPQTVARLCGGGRAAPVASAAWGAALLCVCDLLGRTLVASRDLPVGIVTSAVGAPYLMWVLWRQARRRDV